MKTACFIPIKENSERVSGKNLRILTCKANYEIFWKVVKAF
jgi:CMP-N-acetylneuraminic acid synthetase